MNGSFWTKEETDLLTKHYAHRGGHATQSILAQHGYHRTYKAIGMKARKMLLYRDNPGRADVVPLCWVVPQRAGSVFYTYVKEARKAGALTERAGKPRYWVATEWADRLMVHKPDPLSALGPRQRRILEMILERKRVTTKDVALDLGIPVHHAARPLRTLAERGHVRRHRASGNSLSVWMPA